MREQVKRKRVEKKKSPVNHVHALDHVSEGGEAHTIEVRVVPEIDEHLSGAAVLAGGGKRHVALLVALFDRVVNQFHVAPLARDSRIACAAQLSSDGHVGAVGLMRLAMRKVRPNRNKQP